MADLTRRKLLSRGTAAVSGAALLAVAGDGKALGEGDPANVFHVFAFQWRPGTTEAQKGRALQDIRAFQGVIPGLLETHVGENLSTKGNGYTFGGIMRFTNQAALEAYVLHPAHQALLAWLVPLIVAVELDLRA